MTLEVFDIVGVVVRVGSEERVVVGVGVRVPVSEPVPVTELVPEGVDVFVGVPVPLCERVGEGKGVGATAQNVAPAVLVIPAAQGAQTALEAAPMALDQVPAWQGKHVVGSVAPIVSL